MIIDAKGRTLMPGLIDNHVHLFMAGSAQTEMLDPKATFETLEAKATEEARLMLLRGFTSARDVGGPVFGIKRAIDEGKNIGPRIYPSGAMISQTSGNAFKWATKYHVKLAWGTDLMFVPAQMKNQNSDVIKLQAWLTPAQVLKLVTHDNAQLLALCGLRNPYPGKLGVVEVGSLADLLLVDGDPIADLKIIADPEKNFQVIMKDGKIFKNSLK
jgi:imidazolonepropionase-like amidohydrolase